MLSREGEIAIAKRIEAGRELMIGALCESPLTFEALTVWRDELNEGKVLLRDIIDLEAMYGAGPDGQPPAAEGRRRCRARSGTAHERPAVNGHDAGRRRAADRAIKQPEPGAEAGGEGERIAAAEAAGERPRISTTKAICRCRRWKPR